VLGASYLVHDACPSRIPLAAQRVISLRRAYYSNTGDLVSHPNQ
jgi:hypothetical protein